MGWRGAPKRISFDLASDQRKGRDHMDIDDVAHWLSATTRDEA